MTTRPIKSPDDLAMFKVYLDGRKLPFTVEVTDGRDRSSEQNRLSHKWYKEISEQSGEAVEDVRARCKLEIGVPILREASEAFRKTYDKVLKPLDYEDKIEFVRGTDMAVTRLMNVTQMTEYMDEVFRRHAEFGIVLTVPEDRFAFAPKQARAA